MAADYCRPRVDLKSQYILVTLVAAHFLFTITVCCRDTFAVFAEENTLPPGSLGWRRAETSAASFLGQRLPAASLWRQGIATYLRCAGIEYGYGYFAPNVPDSFNLVFEIHFEDGRVDYEVPSVSGRSTGLRLATILDNVGRIDYPPLRELIVKMLTYSKWQEHPRAKEIRAIVGIVRLPNVAQFERGGTAVYEPINSYQFRFRRHSQ
jgi:hypothetical protein